MFHARARLRTSTHIGAGGIKYLVCIIHLFVSLIALISFDSTERRYRLTRMGLATTSIVSGARFKIKVESLMRGG